jgi:hypothetical protein
MSPPGGEVPTRGGGYDRGVEDLGAQISYMTLEAGALVFSSDGKEVGKVEHVLADIDLDIFDGIVLDQSVLPGGHRFVDAPEVAEIHERGVVLGIDSETAHSLPEPSKNPGEIDIDPGAEKDRTMLKDKLGRAWDLISGKHPTR